MCLTIHDNSIYPHRAEKPIKVKKLLYWREHPHYKDILTPYMFEKVVFTDGRCEMGDGTMSIMETRYSTYSEYREGLTTQYVVENGEVRRIDKMPPYPTDVTSVNVFRGIHAYQWDCESITPMTSIFYNDRGILPFHIDIKEFFVLVEAIIPQGAYYYLGTNGDIVADRMTVTDVDTGPIPWETPRMEEPVPWKEPQEIERPSNDDEG